MMKLAVYILLEYNVSIITFRILNNINIEHYKQYVHDEQNIVL